ncbi:MAG: hypothetical protein MRECE_4c018 [Mycoplasmataceae bacterium CE_OT135]|nr:MAG: hypothetical protein MRECE_4c018 [Mycoplasmataceae bacterium CE_OT135]
MRKLLFKIKKLAYNIYIFAFFSCISHLLLNFSSQDFLTLLKKTNTFLGRLIVGYFCFCFYDILSFSLLGQGVNNKILTGLQPHHNRRKSRKTSKKF